MRMGNGLVFYVMGWKAFPIGSLWRLLLRCTCLLRGPRVIPGLV